MNRCPSCTTGLLKLSGSHKYCDKCNFTVFELTQGYLESATGLLAELVSNTKFPTRNALGHDILGLVESHLPKLNEYFTSVTSGQAELLAKVMESVETQAINLHIGKEAFNESQVAKDLRCTCGNEDFKMLSPGELECSCSAVFRYDEQEGIYKPEFVCKACGCITWEHEDAPLVGCANCHIVYTHDVVHNIFRMVGDE